MTAPFLDVSSFEREVDEAPPPPPPPSSAPGGTWSPFVSVYEGGDDEADAPLREAYTTVVNELYDEEFDESLYELLTDARALHESHVAAGNSSADADRLVTQHFAQLAR